MIAAHGEGVIALLKKLPGVFVLTALVAQGAGAQTGRIVRCEVNGQVVYSDTKCEQAENKQDVDAQLQNTYSTPEPVEKESGSVKSRAAASKSRRGARTQFTVVRDNSAAMAFGTKNESTPEKRSNYSSRPSAGQSAIEKSPNYRADPPAPDPYKNKLRNYDSGSAPTSIADGLAQHKSKCQQMAADLDDANLTRYESRYLDLKGNLKSRDLGKDKEKIGQLEQAMSREKCR